MWPHLQVLDSLSGVYFMSARFPLSFPSVVATGFAIFSMFFGAGNLLFPIELGHLVGSNVWYGYAGLFITGILFALIGMISLILFEGKHTTFFNRLGRRTGLCVEALILIMIGPLTGIPRAIDILYELTLSQVTSLTLSNFVIGFLVIIFACSYKRERIMPLLGYVISPLLVLLLAITIILGIANTSTFIHSSYTPLQSVGRGIREGLSTMDLMAAFHFAPLAVIYLRRMSNRPTLGIKNVTKCALAASLITGCLLSLIYAGLSYIGAHQFGLPSISNPAKLTLAIAKTILPGWMLVPLFVLLFLAITSTAISLTTIFSDFIREEVFSESVTHAHALWITSIATGFAAHGGLHMILSLEKHFLMLCYPPLIVLAICNILYKTTGFRHVKGPVWCSFFLSCAHYLFF